MFRYTKQQRLRSNREYQAVSQGGKRFFIGDWSVYYKANSRTLPRMGIVVSKRVAQNAVVRNKIKRLVRESYRLAQNLPCFDIVIVAKNGLAKKARSEMRVQLETIWDRFREYRTPSC